MPDDVAPAVWRSLAALRERHPAARWTGPEQLHLTLVFLGSTPPEELPRLERAIGDVARHWPAFHVTTGGGGGYINDRRGGVAWLRIAGGRREVARLSLELDRAMASGRYESASPRPHLTLARRVDEALLGDLHANAEKARAGWTVERIALVRSHTGPAGSRYEALAEFALRGDPAS